MPLPSGSVSPRITLDDARSFNGANSDVILGYVRAGIVRYRQQRDRFTVEYTPPIGAGGQPAFAGSLRHISMNSRLRLEFITDDGSGDADWVLPDLIEEISIRANVGPMLLRVSELDYGQVVRGYTITAAYPCYSALQQLSQAFFFDPSNVDGRIHFVPRGRDAVAHIVEDDMIDNDTPVDGDSRRGDSISVPRVLHLNYYDVAGGLNTDKQHSERPEGSRSEGEASMQTTVILSADEAATIVGKTHALMVEQQKGELSVPLPDNWLRLAESDPVHVSFDGKTVRGIIGEVRIEDGEQHYKIARDRQSIYTMQVEGIPAAPITRPPSSVAGPTLVEFIDIPILRDSHDMLGYYLAVSGVMPAWPGAFVELSLDGGQTWFEGQRTNVGSIMGTLASPLGDHPQAFPDSVNACEVAITTPHVTLEGVSLANMQNRRNLALIGDELVNFGDVDEVSEGVWELSRFLRGRKGTDSTAHAIGERFVLLDTAAFIPADLTTLGQTLTFRATTIGRPTDEATTVTVTFAGRSQTERAPAYLQARRNADNVIASWQGVGRLGGGAHVAMGAHFAGYVVTLTDGVTTQTHHTAAPEFFGSLAAFSGPVSVSVQQRNNFTGLGPAIEVTI